MRIVKIPKIEIDLTIGRMLRFQFSKIRTWNNFIIHDFPGVEDFIGVGLLRSSDADESLENFVENCVLIFIKIVKIRKW